MDDALAPGQGKRLIGESILFRWPATAVAGGWAVGKITSTISGADFNFAAVYACDGPEAPSCKHCLAAKTYARSVKAPIDSWALLGRP